MTPLLLFKEFSLAYDIMLQDDITLEEALQEAIKILSKNTDPNKKIELENNSEEKKTITIGKIDNKIVTIKSNHINKPRDKNTEPRRKNLTDNDIFNIISRFKLKLTENGKLKIIYKNTNNKYDCLILYIKNDIIQINTIILNNKDNPVYETKDEIKTIIEQ